MTINDPDAYLASLWDWGCLAGCFGNTKIEPTDIDGFVERNGKFLFIETKLPEVPIPMGQQITFSRLIETGNFTIIVVWGHPNDPEKIELRTSQTVRVYENSDLDTFRNIVIQWFEWAENQTPMPRFY